MNGTNPITPPEPPLQQLAVPPLMSIFKDFPKSLKIAWACIFAVVAMFGFVLSRYWLEGYDTTDRFLIVVLSLWCWWRMRGAISQIPSKPLPLLGIPLLFVGFLTVFPTWFLYFQIGARPAILWMFYVSAIATLIGMTLLQFGWRTLAMIRFPLFVLILALPIPGRINSPIQSFLQNATTTFAFKALQFTGYDVVREGFVLRLPHGDLGVVEACSGIKAFSTFLAVASFASYFFGFGLRRGILALIISIPLVILTNGMRVYGMGVVSESFGQEATQGWKHEVLGGIPVLIGLGALIYLLKLLSKWKVESPNTIDASPSLPVSYFASTVAMAIAVVGISLGIYGASQRSVARPALLDGNPPLESIPMTIGEWNGNDLPINPEIMNELSSNKALFRSYTNRLGYEYYVWVIYWPTAKSVKGYHHPDICMPNQGNTLLLKEDVSEKTKGGRSIPVTYREFGKGAERQLVAYWTQEGREFWNAEDEVIASSQMSYPFRWIQKRMGDRPADATDDRIVVLIGTKKWGSSLIPRESMFKFTGLFADELYRVCPWADPGQH